MAWFAQAAQIDDTSKAPEDRHPPTFSLAFMADTAYVVGFLCAVVVVCEILVRRTALRHLGTSLLVILVAALLANIGVLPTGLSEAGPIPAYDFIFGTVAPFAIFCLLLPVNLRDVLQAGMPMILMFLVGSMGTAVGVFVGMWLVNGPETIGPLFNAIGGMFVGTYTGGSINFNAVALEYDVVREGVLYTGAVVVDSVMTTIWMVVTIAIPRFFAHRWPKRTGASTAPTVGEASAGVEEDTETMHPMDVGLVLALGLGAVWASEQLAELMPAVPSIVILTAIALLLAQLPRLSSLTGVRVIGMFAVYLFLTVIGVYCDLGAVAGIGDLGGTLLAFAGVTVLTHGVIVYGISLIFRVDPVIASIATQANIGGGPTALALARSLGREDLVLPGILVGSLGSALGTFMGFWVSGGWLPILG